jgi:hypothetical protein
MSRAFLTLPPRRVVPSSRATVSAFTVAFLLGTSIGAATDVELRFERSLSAFEVQMPQMGTSGRVRLGQGTGSDCAGLALRQAKPSLDYAIRKRGAWEAFKTTVSLSPVGGKLTDAVGLLNDYVDSDGPEDFARRIGKTLVSKGAGRAAGSGAGYASGKVAGKLYDELTKKLEKGFSYSYKSQSCGDIYIYSFMRRRADAGGLEIVFEIDGDCACRVKDRFDQVELGAWAVRGVLPIDAKVSGTGSGATVVLAIPAGEVGDWYVAAKCPCLQAGGDEDSSKGPSLPHPGVKPFVHVGYGGGFTASDWDCAKKFEGSWKWYGDLQDAAKASEKAAQEADADARDAATAAAKNRVKARQADKLLHTPQRYTSNLANVLADAKKTVDRQRRLDETARDQRKKADEARNHARLAKRLADSVLARLKDELRTYIKDKTAKKGKQAFGTGEKLSATVPDWAKELQREFLLPTLGEMRKAGEIATEEAETTSEIAAGEAGAVELRVGAPGHERPGVTVDFSGGDGRTVRKVTDGTGTVSVALAKGSYSVVVGGGGEPVHGTVEVEAGKLSSFTADSGGVAASGPLPAEVRPADAVAEKGYDISYRVDYGLFTIQIDTPEGKVYLSAPETTEADSQVSYGVVAAPDGNSPRQLAKYRSELKRSDVVVNDRDLDVDVAGTVQLTAKSSAKVALRRHGKTMVQGTVPFPPPESSSVVRWHGQDTRTGEAAGPGEGSRTVLAGGAFGLPGHFDGDASNTRLTVGGKPTRVAAESTLAVYFYTPADAIGPLEIVAEDGGVTTTGTVNNLGLKFWADQTDLLRGQRTTCHVRVSGLEGLERPVYLALVNRTPGVISLSPADAQLLVLAPGGAGTPGTFQADRAMVGVTPGGFVLTAAVTPR